MRKNSPVDLKISVLDKQYLQERVNALFLDIVKFNLDNFNLNSNQKLDYIENIIESLKSR